MYPVAQPIESQRCQLVVEFAFRDWLAVPANWLIDPVASFTAPTSRELLSCLDGSAALTAWDVLQGFVHDYVEPFRYDL